MAEMKSGVPEIKRRRSAFVELESFDLTARLSDFVEVVEWINGNGIDISINNRTPQRMSLTWGEFDAIKACISALDNEDPE